MVKGDNRAFIERREREMKKRAFLGMLLIVFAAAGFGPVRAAAPEEELSLDEAVPGEAIILMKENEADPRGASGASGEAAALLEQGELLMDVSPGAEAIEKKEAAEAEEAEPDGPKALGLEPAPSASPEKTVIRLVRSEEYGTEELMEMFADYPGVISVEPNAVFRLSDAGEAGQEEQEASGEESAGETYPDLTKSQAVFSDGAGGINVPDWNDPEKENASGVVAILGSGVDYTHPDLQASMWDEGENYPELRAAGGGKYGINTYASEDGSASEDPADVFGGGTQSAGLIAAAWNGEGISGGANGVKLMAVRVFNSQGSCDLSHVLCGFNYIATAKMAGVDVVCVNCNTWDIFEGKSMDYMLAAMEMRGIVVVSGSGINSINLDHYLAYPSLSSAHPGNITVNVSDQSGNALERSNYGLRSTHLYAPGKKVLTTVMTSSAALLADREASPPAVDGNGTELADDYEGEETCFTYEANEGSSTSLTIGDGVLSLSGTTRGLETDEISAETLPQGTTDRAVACSIKAPALPELSEGEKYHLLLTLRSEQEKLYPMVYVKTAEGGWDRPDYTDVVGKDYATFAYPLDKGLSGAAFDLEAPEFRIVYYSTDSEASMGKLEVDALWISKAGAVPYAYVNTSSNALVSAETAILAKAFPEDSAAKRAARILAGVSFNEAFAERCVTGGQANVSYALNEEMYTPVVTQVDEDSWKRLLIEGYFFGDADKLEVTLQQGDRVWKSGKDFRIIKVSQGDPERLLVTEPAGLVKGELAVTLRNTGKTEGRESFSRTFPIEPSPGFVTTSYPGTAYAGFYPRSMTGLKGSLYFLGRDVTDLEVKLMSYTPGAEEKWKIYPVKSGVNYFRSLCVWNGKLLWIGSVEQDKKALLTIWDPESGSFRNTALSGETPDFREEHLISLYYDGEKLLLLRTLLSDASAEPSEIYEVDPWLFRIKKLGTLKGSYPDPVITHREEETEEGTVKRIIVSGQDVLTDGLLVSEAFIPAEGFTSEYLDIAPDALAPVFSGDREWSGCGTKDGIFLAGFDHFEEDEAGRGEILADNYFYAYDEEGRFEAGAARIGGQVSNITSAAAYDGKIYLTVFRTGREGSFVLMETDAETRDQGDAEIQTGTDPAVKVKKLTLDQKKLVLENGDTGTLTANAVFQDPSVQCGFLFESTNPAVVSVNPLTGEYTARNQGSAVLRVSCGNKTAICKVSVSLNEETSGCGGLNHTELTLKEGELGQLSTVLGMYKSGKERIVWKSSDPKVVSVNQGFVTAKKAGTAEVTLTRSEGSFRETLSCSVTVTPVEVLPASSGDKGVKLTLSKSAIKVNAGETAELKAVLNGADFAGRTVVMRSTNPELACFEGEKEEVVLTPGASAGKKNRGEASALLYGVKAGTVTIEVESFAGSPEERTSTTPLNRRLIRVTVDAPVQAVELYFSTEYEDYAASAPDEQLSDYDLVLYPGNVVPLVIVAEPEPCTDLLKTKWTASGGVSVKNGVVTAKSPSKKDKEGNPVPAEVTCSVGNVKFTTKILVRG